MSEMAGIEQPIGLAPVSLNDQGAANILNVLHQHVGQGASPVSFLVDVETVITLEADETGEPVMQRSRKMVALWTLTNQGAHKVIVHPDAAETLAEGIRTKAILARTGLIGVSPAPNGHKG